MHRRKLAIVSAILAASFYAINIPISKSMLEDVDPSALASLLYLGAGIGMTFLSIAFRRKDAASRIQRSDLIYVIGMIVLDIAAPILMMKGISETYSSNASLLNNFEIVATTIIAVILFKERTSLLFLCAMLLIVVSGIILGYDGGTMTFDTGSVYIMGACLCWGLENNCTRAISGRDPFRIVSIKGIFSGLGCMIVALIAGESFPGIGFMAGGLVLGFVAYGLSIAFYVRAQRDIGAAKTSAYYSVAPFLGVMFAFLLLGERPAMTFYIALAIMVLATIMMIRDTLGSDDETVCPSPE